MLARGGYYEYDLQATSAAFNSRCDSDNALLFGSDGKFGLAKLYFSQKAALADLERVQSSLRSGHSALAARERDSLENLSLAPGIRDKMNRVERGLAIVDKSEASLREQFTQTTDQVVAVRRKLRDGGCKEGAPRHSSVVAAENGNWAGDYEDSNGVVVKITGTGATVEGAYTFRPTDPAKGGQQSISSCRVTGRTTAECVSEGEYHDQDKSIKHDGTVALTFSGDTLTYVYKIEHATPTWKPGVEHYTSNVSAGNTITFVLHRKH